MLDRISGTEDERIYMAYIAIHKWLVNIGGVATAHGITLDSSISMLNSMIAADTVVGHTGETRYSLRPYLERYVNKIR